MSSKTSHHGSGSSGLISGLSFSVGLVIYRLEIDGFSSDVDLALGFKSFEDYIVHSSCHCNHCAGV